MYSTIYFSSQALSLCYAIIRITFPVYREWCTVSRSEPLKVFSNHLSINIALKKLTTGRVSLWFYSNFGGLMIRTLCFFLLSSPAGIQSFKECGYAVLLITNDFYYLLPHCVQMGESSAQVSTTIGWTAADVHSAS